MSLIVYKSYAARVDFDASKVCLVGKITGVEPEIIFYGKTLEEIQSEFHRAVDQHLMAVQDNVAETESKIY